MELTLNWYKACQIGRQESGFRVNEGRRSIIWFIGSNGNELYFVL